ncbi:MAG: ribosome small subunit-dependent GTPase A [Bacteroidales bacterium]
MRDTVEGTVLKSTGSRYIVECTHGRVLSCSIRGKFRLKGIRNTNPVAVGDNVAVEPDAGVEHSGVIVGISPRKNYIIRKSTNLSKEAHIIASNVDRAFIVVTLKMPETTFTFVDRFLASAEAYRIPASIVFNKADIYKDDIDYLAQWIDTYQLAGYDWLLTSTLTGQGVDELKMLMKDKISVFAGHSGVGKSSLANSVEPGLELKTSKISESRHKSGKHTTTFAEMFRLSFGGAIIDTPGIRAFGVLDMAKEEISHFFPEIFKYSEVCRFNNCTHTNEPNCAVKQAVEDELIASTRYNSYLGLLEDDTKHRM